MTKTEKFIKKSIKIHGYKYSYTSVDYLNSKVKVDITCKEHGLFSQTPNNHLKGQNCPKCNYRNVFNNDDFIIQSNKIHKNKYDYTKTHYTMSNVKVEIICSKHNSFFITPGSHLNGRGCIKCGKEEMANKNRKSKEYIISKFYDVHDNLYDYSLVNYLSTKTKVDIICKKHGLFSQTPEKHIYGNGCPTCKSSKGERKIISLLEKNNIDYISQKTFTDCKNVLPLPFDFYLPEQNICIEFDGKQHFEPIEWFGGSDAFESLKERDEIKNKFCLSNNIDLLRIAYYDYDNIEHIIRSKINI